MAKINKARMRQIGLVGGVLILLVSVIVIGLYVAEKENGPPPAPQTKVQGRQIKAPGGQTESREISQSITDAKIAELQELIEKSGREAKEKDDKDRRDSEERDRREKQRAEDEVRKRPDSAAPGGSGSGPTTGTGFKIFDPSKLGADAPRSNAQPTDPNAPAASPPALQRRMVNIEVGANESSSGAGKTNGSSGTFSDFTKVGETLRGLQSSASVPRSAENYVPSGTFFKVRLINGLDAPTGGQSQNNPHPFLMQIISYGNLPNRFKTDVKYCHVIGQGWGDITSERAYGRTEQLSCVRANGDVIDIPVTGYVVGGDGKTGIRGTVLTKQGEVIGKALWTSALASFGDVARSASTSVNIYAGGTTVGTDNGMSTSDLMRRGALGGLGDAAKQLSQYYIKLAETLWPVVQIDGGQTAEVVLTQGFSLVQNQSNTFGTFSDFKSSGLNLRGISTQNR